MESQEVAAKCGNPNPPPPKEENGYVGHHESGLGVRYTAPHPHPQEYAHRQGIHLLHQQSNLADIHLQQQQLLQQFSLLHRNITHKNNNLSGGGLTKTTSHPLFSHGCCKWAGCDTHCPTTDEFFRHLSRVHILDDKSTAQTKVQIQIVEQLEQQLQKEQHRLKAMMDHLKKSKHSPTVAKQEENDQMEAKESQLCLPFLSPTSAHPPSLTLPTAKLHSQVGPIRKRSIKSEEGCEVYQHQQRCGRGEKGGHDVESEMTDNREFYLSQDVRPPFTYAALIRQAINESRGRQLTLNEIYNWFQANFAFFRRNAATWKNAVRHNLSLHKCFSRVENVKGAVWTVDEVEYHRRRPQRSSDHSAQENSPPPNPLVYEDSFNRTLQSALLNLGKTGEHYLAAFGEERPRPVSPPRMVSYQRYPSYQSGTQEEEEEERRSPLTEEEEGMGSKVEVEGSAIAYNTTTTDHDINDINGEEEKVDEEEEDTLPQDLSMISNRNVDS